VPALVPVADWSRVRILLTEIPVAERGNFAAARTLDLRRACSFRTQLRTRAGVTVTGHELRLVSLADRSVGLQLCGSRWIATAST
jgi:hypothetical protein